MSVSGFLGPESPCANVVPGKVQVISELPKVPPVPIQEIESPGSDSGFNVNQVDPYSGQTLETIGCCHMDSLLS